MRLHVSRLGAALRGGWFARSGIERSVPSGPNGGADDLGGCHTAKVVGYAVEGHVPVAAVQRMLTERPDIIGLHTGMPMNSPGMEIEGEGEAVDVIAFAANGSRSVFMEVRP